MPQTYTLDPSLRTPLFGLAALLFFVGMAGMLLLCHLLYQLFYFPTEIALLQFLLEKMGDTDQLLFGEMAHQTLDIRLGATLKYPLIFLVIWVMVSLVGSVAKALLSMGMEIFKFVAQSHPPEPSAADRLLRHRPSNVPVRPAT